VVVAIDPAAAAAVTEAAADLAAAAEEDVNLLFQNTMNTKKPDIFIRFFFRLNPSINFVPL